MASLKTVIYLEVCLSAWILCTVGDSFAPKAENVHWVSLDFKTILTWTNKASDYKYTVQYSRDGNDWTDTECIRLSESECDLTEDLMFSDRSYSADIQTKPPTLDFDYDFDEFPHTYSTHFNPYKESNISAVTFSVKAVDEHTVIINITDPLTGIHQGDKQLTIRDVLKKDLKYKISYYKSGRTGKRDNISDTSVAEVSGLDAGEQYCFMVAAFIPSRPKATQQGAWSMQSCIEGYVEEWSLGAWVGVAIIVLTILITIITVTILCYRCCRQRNRTLHTSQSSAPV
ncbi:tissue factor-like [Pempheris klunzingeri]|uniref:tissue factor-like n=1 Tax=Pempheris klunzingeri TaxID=3127111 RepID=UPI00397F7628